MLTFLEVQEAFEVQFGELAYMVDLDSESKGVDKPEVFQTIVTVWEGYCSPFK